MFHILNLNSQMQASSLSLESIPIELQNIIAEFTFPKNFFNSPLFRLGICLRSCNSTYREIYSLTMQSEIKSNDKMINFKFRPLYEEILSLLFRPDHGILHGIEHIDLSQGRFTFNLLRMLPSTLKTLCLEEVGLVSLD